MPGGQELFPFFPDTRSCERGLRGPDLAPVPRSPKGNLGRSGLLSVGGPTPRPDPRGRGLTLQPKFGSPMPTPAPSLLPPRAPTRQQRVPSRPRGLPYRKVSSISLMVVSFSTTRKLGWRFLLSSPMPPSRKPVTVSSSPITAISFPLPAILTDRSRSSATAGCYRSPAFAAHRLRPAPQPPNACAVVPLRLLGHAH